MTGRPGVDYDDVCKTIRILAHNDMKITVDNIRLVLGTGSKTTLSRHLRRWKGDNRKNDNYDSLRKDMINLVAKMALRLGMKERDLFD